jgi:DNA-binding GntR family transcriptional regulator
MPAARLRAPPAARAAGGVPLAERVYAELKKALRTGHFEPGERIREEAVAKWLEVSRTPVREALRRLVSDNLLVSTEHGLAVPRLSRDQIFELYAMREVLEGAAAALAAQHASAAEVDFLNQILREQAAAKSDAERLLAINKELHGCIYRAANNRYLVRTLQSLQDELEQLRGTTFSWPGRPKEALKEHRAIVQAIERHDARAAEKAARLHVSAALRLRLLIMRRDADQPSAYDLKPQRRSVLSK